MIQRENWQAILGATTKVQTQESPYDIRANLTQPNHRYVRYAPYLQRAVRNFPISH